MNFREERNNLIDVLFTLKTFQKASKHPEVLEKAYKQMKRDTTRVYDMVQKSRYEKPQETNNQSVTVG